MMTAIVLRYRTFIAILGLIVMGIILWIFLTRVNSSKIPSRGVFVLQTVELRETVLIEYGGTDGEKNDKEGISEIC